ncbi:MAG: hypothetical protein FWH00_03035 [Oscillospiraceae bacterium]|nr:hypothetical protein [Oscillospiraceae bacterium]
MNTLKTMAIVYETKNEHLCHKAMKSMMLDIHYFTLIPVDPAQESSYALWKEGEMAKNLELKLKVAQDIYIVNPKGAIMQCVGGILAYAEQHKKTVHYMYKYCYNDCEHLKAGFGGKLKCLGADLIMSIPSHHKFLPACEKYTRVFDSVIGRTEPVMLTGNVAENVLLFGDKLPDSDENDENNMQESIV